MVGETGSVSGFGSFLFPHIFRSFRMAIQPSKLAIAFIALTAICLTGRLMDLSRTVVVSNHLSSSTVDAGGSHRITELDAYLGSEREEIEMPAFLKTYRANRGRPGVFMTLWTFAEVRFDSALGAVFTVDAPRFAGSVYRCVRALVWAFRYHTIYSIVFFAVVLVVLSLAGGAICRMAALQFARDERLGLTRVAKFARRKFVTLIVTPVGPYAIAILLGLPVILLGLIGNIPYAGELLAGLLLPLALVVAPFIAVIVIGAVAGLNLMFPAVAYEDSDFFDAISRSFSNVYAKPWRMAFYTLVAIIYGAICYVFVRFFVFLLLWLTHWFLQLGMGNAKLEAIWPEPSPTELIGVMAVTPDAWSLWFAALLIRVWLLIVIGLMISFLISFYFSASTIIYALMRNRVDGTPLDEIYGDQEEATPESPRPDAVPQVETPSSEEKADRAPDKAGETSP